MLHPRHRCFRLLARQRQRDASYVLPPGERSALVSSTAVIILAILLTLALAYLLSEWLARGALRDDEA